MRGLFPRSTSPTSTVTPLARQARRLLHYPVGDLACFNVDFSREFRYCLETGADPTPVSELSMVQLSVPVTETSNDTYGEQSIGSDTVTGSQLVYPNRSRSIASSSEPG